MHWSLHRWSRASELESSPTTSSSAVYSDSGFVVCVLSNALRRAQSSPAQGIPLGHRKSAPGSQEVCPWVHHRPPSPLFTPPARHRPPSPLPHPAAPSLPSIAPLHPAGPSSPSVAPPSPRRPVIALCRPSLTPPARHRPPSPLPHPAGPSSPSIAPPSPHRPVIALRRPSSPRRPVIAAVHLVPQPLRDLESGRLLVRLPVVVVGLQVTHQLGNIAERWQHTTNNLNNTQRLVSSGSQHKGPAQRTSTKDQHKGPAQRTSTKDGLVWFSF